MRYRTKPFEIEAIQWTGDNEAEVQTLAPGKFYALTENDRLNADDPDATAEVFDYLHSTWVLVFDGQWVIKGMKGEFYPCDDEVFRTKYEAIDG